MAPQGIGLGHLFRPGSSPKEAEGAPGVGLDAGKPAVHCREAREVSARLYSNAKLCNVLSSLGQSDATVEETDCSPFDTGT